MAITGRITYRECEFEIQNGRYVEQDTGQVFDTLAEFDAQVDSPAPDDGIAHIWVEDDVYMVRMKTGAIYRTTIPAKEA